LFWLPILRFPTLFWRRGGNNPPFDQEDVDHKIPIYVFIQENTGGVLTERYIYWLIRALIIVVILLIQQINI